MIFLVVNDSIGTCKIKSLTFNPPPLYVTFLPRLLNCGWAYLVTQLVLKFADRTGQKTVFQIDKKYFGDF